MSIKLKGSTDGSVTLQAPADTSPTGTDKTLTLPTTTGSANQFVKNGGTAGELEYSSMVEDSSGKVGIGTSPSEALHVKSTSGTQLILERDGTTTQIASVVFKDGSGDQNRISSSDSNLIFGSGAGNTERLRINSNGALKASTSGSFATTNESHEFTGSVDSVPIITAYHNSTNYAADGFRLAVQRSASQSYNLAIFESGGIGGDTEFRLRGDGSGFADGDWNTGGADYAEFFEWSDGNASSEDRRGISVVLVDDKIREAVAGEDPIGVISGNPSVVGDAAWNKWTGKHLRDDYGSYILNANGERQLNPDYDPDATYVPREERAEWDCVGLMGKLRIRKGQVTGSRWIKMRDVSDTVEEWLVR